MNEDAARRIYDGARLRISDQEWFLLVDGIETRASTTAYRLFFHVTRGDRRIHGLAIDVRTPETWPAERVLKAVQDALERGWTPQSDADALVLTDEIH
jgi:hypothetical protein